MLKLNLEHDEKLDVVVQLFDFKVGKFLENAKASDDV